MIVPEPLGAGNEFEKPETGKTISYPLPRSNAAQDIGNMVADVLRKHKGATAIHVMSGEGILVEFPEGMEVPNIDNMPVLLADIVRKIQLHPVANSWATPAEYVRNVMEQAKREGAFSHFIVAGDRAKFLEWLGIDPKVHATTREAYGMTIHAAGGALPADSAVICVSREKLATPMDVSWGYLIRLDAPRPRETQI